MNRVYSIALEPALAHGVATAFGDVGGLVELADGQSALDLVDLGTPAVILARFPLPDLPLDRFCGRVRAGDSPWREVPLVLFCTADQVGEASAWLGRGATRVFVDAPVIGEAKVARRATRERERLDGYGLRFLAFEGDGKRRLQALLHRTEPTA